MNEEAIRNHIEEVLRKEPRKTGEVVSAVQQVVGAQGQAAATVRQVLWRMLDAGQIQVMTDWKLQLEKP